MSLDEEQNRLRKLSMCLEKGKCIFGKRGMCLDKKKHVSKKRHVLGYRQEMFFGNESCAWTEIFVFSGNEACAQINPTSLVGDKLFRCSYW